MKLNAPRIVDQLPTRKLVRIEPNWSHPLGFNFNFKRVGTRFSASPDLRAMTAHDYH